MTKAKTNALDALRSLIAERQQYEQWISALEAKREGTAEHVFDRVRGDYQTRLERVVSDIRGHAEELQLSISTLSSRLVEVAREEDTRREGLQEAELRAAVGEYEPSQWDQLRGDAVRALEKIASDRASLDSQLSELRAIQKLSEVSGSATVAESPAPIEVVAEPMSPAAPAAPAPAPVPEVKREEAPPVAAAPEPPKPEPQRPEPPRQDPPKPADQPRLPLDPVAAAASAAAAVTSRPRSTRTPPGGVSSVRSRSEAVKPDASKTLKCPECGTANYPTEWYCERCGGELATM
jgi:outer membrane biosynthesis protein TonB